MEDSPFPGGQLLPAVIESTDLLLWILVCYGYQSDMARVKEW